VEGKKDASVQRYKGLGEMNAEQLAETTMNPEKRTLLQVRLASAVRPKSCLFCGAGNLALQPPFRRLFRGRRAFSITEERRLKAGGSQDWLPHKRWILAILLAALL
jgi:DNA gyrase subunit B